MFSIPSETTHISETSIQILPLWQAARLLGFPAAMWRLPQSGEIRLLISVREGTQFVQPDLERLAPGFLISKFNWEHDKGVQFLEGDIILGFAENGALTSSQNTLGEEHPEYKKLVQLAEEIALAGEENSATLPFLDAQSDQLDARQRFERIVELAVAAIRQNQFKKVVLSRTKDFAYSEHFEPAKAFQKLTSVYPSAFISLVSLPEENEIWLGATPEILVQQNARGIFRTMSLAGTQRASCDAGGLIPRYDIRWGEKEIEEQALVSRYIVECFKKIRLREYLETGPKTVLAGNLYHLRTDFEVDTTALNFPELASVMLKLLHPTSAVCGVPKIPSQHFLHEVEGYDRSFYSGFLGPAQVGEETHLFVNLRTVRFKNGKATFFAGAGITEDSVPGQEWEETELKCDTLLKVIRDIF